MAGSSMSKKKEGSFGSVLNPYAEHFDNPPSEALDDFDEAFDLGAQAAHEGKSFEACPYGLPEDVDWRQDTLLRHPNPKLAGWLLGWWAADWGHLDGRSESEEEARLYGSGWMAALLWEGRQAFLDAEGVDEGDRP